MKGDIAVHVENLTVRFGDFTAVNNISFEVKRGEIFGFLGANGAGKTTTIRVLCGLLEPASGVVRVAGLGFEGGGRAIKRKVGYMSQRFTLFNDLTIEENLSFIASLHRLDDAAFRRREEELFSFIRIKAGKGTMVADLPGGEKQEVSLIASLLHSPEVVFLDEPTAGVSPAARRRFWELIRSLSRSGITVFVTTHYMDEAEQCDRIALMRAGEIIALDTPASLKEKTFPEPLIELDFGPHPGRHAAALRESGAVADLQPYGMRYHARVADPAAFDRARAAIPDLQWRRVAPSLEDVFVRLVEGENR
jgi:ABC-2 type transport system ATP-binding protein